MKSLKLFIVLWFVSFAGFTQNITYMEYFVDTDPGYGNAVPIPFSGSEIAEANFTVPFNGLDNGIHFLYLRAQNQEGDWSMTSVHHILKDVFHSDGAEIDQAEYFIDTDPGYGNGTPVSVSSGEVVDMAFDLDVSGLDNGLHLLYIRTRTTDGAWSMPHVHHLLVDVFNLPDTEISEIEYFFDTDPGNGNGTSVPVSPGASVDVAFQADMSGLSTGTHFLYTRAKSSDGTWGTLHQQLVLVDVIENSLTDITDVEYFIDDDPGFGNATPVSVTPSSIQEIDFGVNLDELESGIHFITVRAKTENDVWSHCYTNLFLVDVLQIQPENITQVEYFIDDDPGLGNGQNVPVTPAQVIDLDFLVEPGAIDPGLHFLCIRAKDEDGIWSMSYVQPFLYEFMQSDENRDITYLEYFVNDDPGFGNATSVLVTPSPVVELGFDVQPDALESGMHFLHIRGRDEDGIWSLTETHAFLYNFMQNQQNRDITYFEYFVDDDPGYGNAIPVDVNGAPVVELDFVADLETMEPGMHFLVLRGQDEDGVWSLCNVHPFFIGGWGEESNITHLEYFFDEDPGYGTGNVVNIDPATQVVSLDFNMDLSGIPEGQHLLYTRAMDENGAWSSTMIDTLEVLPPSGEFALSFDGVDDYLEAGDVPFPGGDLTIEAWIRAENFAGTQEIAYFFGDTDGVQFRLNQDGSLLYGESAGGNWSYVLSESAAIQPGLWTHVAVTKAGDHCNLYINGYHAGYYQFDNDPVTHTLNFGGRGNNLDRFISGDIDEVRIWQTARTQQEIRDNLCAAFTGIETGLYGLWHFDDGPGSGVASDAGPNGFGAWLYNMNIPAGPDCSWIDHECELPASLDLAVKTIVSPDELVWTEQASDNTVSAEIKNWGMDDFNGEVTLSYTLDSGAPVEEVVSLSIPAGGSAAHDFAAPIDLSTAGSYVLEVSVSTVDDTYTANNLLEKTIQSVNIGRRVYAYNTWPSGSGLPKGPVVFDLENPGYVFSLADQSSQNHLQGGTWIDDQWYAIASDTLYSIDTVSGERTMIGVQENFITALAYDQSEGKLYGQSWVSLYEIDPLTGSTTYVGYSGTEGFVALACTDQGELFALNTEDDMLYSVSKTDGSATAVGNIGFNANYQQDMEFDPETGQIYMAAFNDETGAGELRVIDPATGNSVPNGTFRGGMEVSGFAIPYTEVIPAPVADFGASPVSGFVPLEVQFTDISAGEIDSWQWDFGDGHTSSLQHPSHIYDSPGSYTVSLTVSGPGGTDSKTMEGYINVDPVTIYDIQFAMNPGPDGTYPSEFAGQEVTVSGIVTATGYNGNQNEFFMTDPAGGPWNSIFIFNGSQEVQAGDEVVVSGLIQEYFGMTEFNSPDVTILSNGNTIPSPVIVTTGSLIYPESAEQWECCLVQTENPEVTQLPDPDGEWYIDDGTGECQVDDRIYMYNPYMGETFEYIIGAVDYSFGEYGLNPRMEEDILPFMLEADFAATPVSGFLPLSVDFSDLSTGEPDEWLWDFGDGQTSTGQNPAHVYETFGNYTVTLTVTSNGVSDTEIKTDLIQVYQSQNGDWSLQHLCLENTPEAELMIRSGDIDNLGFGWPDGFDPFTGESTPEHNFPWTPDPEDIGGTDRIMVVTSYNGTSVPCGTDGYTNTTSRPGNLPEPVVIDLCQLSQGEITSAALQVFVDDIQPQSFCSEFTVTLNGETFTPLQTIVNRIDQSGPIGRMLTIRIPEELLYHLDGDQLELEIDDFTTGAGDGFAIDFVKLLINNGQLAHSGTINGFVYDADSGDPIEGATVEASFWETGVTIADGSYFISEAPAGLVYLECEAAGYQSDYTLVNLASGENLEIDFWLDPELIADFSATPLSGTVPLEVQFTDLSSGIPDAWDWDFGDGTTSTLQNPVHVYDTPGVYTVSLVVSNGETDDEITKVNYINVTPSGSGNWIAEYFYDEDPGYGNGVSVYGNGDDDVAISFNAPISQLVDGLHTFYLRSKNEDGSWSQTMSRPFIKQHLPGDADPQITCLEYFFDDDPGFGQATPIEVDAVSPLEVAVNLPLEELDYGMHTLYIRSKDENGRWSIVMQRTFIKGNYPADPLKELVRAEYFIDEDPGQGNGEPVMFDPNNGIHEQQFDVNLEGYEWGEHMLYVRTVDESGSWSITMAEPFDVEEPPIIADFSADITQGSVPLTVQFADETYVSTPDEWFWDFGDGNTSSQQNPQHVYANPGMYTVSLTATGPEGTDTEVKEDYITVYPPLYSLEYFFDEDPGYGNGNGVYAYSSNLGGFDFMVPVDDLDDGFHQLYVRIKDTAHVWTQTMARPFLKTRLISDPDPYITAVEYFVDADPGYGEGTVLPASQIPQPVVDALIPLDMYDDGLHNLYVRSKDQNGKWSETFVRPFLKSYVPADVVNVTKLEYFIDEDPGAGNGTAVPIPDPQAAVERNFVVELAAQTPGEHRLFVRAIDERGHWSVVYQTLFEVTSTGAVHVLQIPQGWSGISSYVVPDDPAVESIFASVSDELVILQNFDGMYWPSAGVNTLGNWDDHAGYQVKMETAQQVTFSGSMQDNLMANLSAGWNYLPVLNACDNDAELLFNQISSHLQIVKDVAGTGVYWPQFGINTLGSISPGKAYFVLVDADVSLEFPVCEQDLTGFENLPGLKGETLTGFETLSGLATDDHSAPTHTPVTHTIAIPASVAAGLNEGDVIRVLNDRGMVTGVMLCHAGNNVLTAFGDDPTTPAVDGMTSGEQIRMEILSPETGKAFPLQVTWAANMPHGGNFAAHGISAIESLQVTDMGEEENLKANMTLHPNPSKGRFYITTGLRDFGWEVTDIHGSSLITGNDQSEDFSIDMTTYPKGIYYLKITQGGLQVLRKLVLH